MKRFRVHLILALTLFLLIIMPFSIVQGDPPVIVQNKATMIKPYEIGYAEHGQYDGKKEAQADSKFDASAGIAYARAYASASALESSNAWAYSYVQDAFEIIHSSNYNITFRFNYKGLAKITGIADYRTANAKVYLKVYLIDSNDGEIISQKNETIVDLTYENEIELIGQRDLALTIPLEENHIYDWRAELRTEASAVNISFEGETQATANFFDTNLGYQAEITQVFVEDLNPDYVPPMTTASLSGTAGENGWYTSSVTISLSATDTSYGVDYTNQRINGGQWTLYTEPFTISTEGTNTVEYYSVDKANNKETTKTESIKIDKTPPTGQITINNNDQYTGSEEVLIYVVTQDGQGSGLSQMRFRNEGDSWDPWIAYTTAPTHWTLKTGDGSKRVYAQFKDNAGNVSPETYDTIILDTEPPMTTASLSGTAGENGWYTSSVTISLSATDTSYGVDYTNQRINGGQWTLYTEPFTISTEGTNTVEYYSVDKANNKETTKTESIKIDKTPPTGQITINNGDAYTSSALVTLSLTYEDTSSGVFKVRYSNDEVWDTEAWENPVTTKYWTLTSGEGIKTVYYQTKDNAGNISPTTSDNIILDTEPPSATIIINEGDEYANSTSVTLYLQYSDNQGIDLVRYSNDGVSYTKWERPSETKQWTLLSGDGTKTVYAQFRDWAGLNSNFVSDTIILDTVPPTGSIRINNGALSTTSMSVTITYNATDANGVAQMRLRNDGGDWSNWEEVATITWNLTSGLGSKTVFAQFKDNAGLISSDCNATINLIKPEPTSTPTPTPSSTPSERGTVIIYVKDANNDAVFGATVTSITQPTGQSPLKGTTDSRGAVTFNNIIVGSYSFHASKGVFGSENVQVTVKSQQTASVNITLIEDLIKPSISVTLTPENSGIPHRVFSVTAEDDIQGSGIATITLYVDESPVVTWTTAGTHIYDEGVYSNGTHTYYVEAVDNAGNIVRNPVSGFLEFTVEEGALMEQMELWKLLAVVLVLANGTALVFLTMRRKK